MKISTIVLLLAVLVSVHADVYLHNPRGQNNRCDEKSNDRNNNKRCWDSENNSAGGYATSDGTMKYFEGSVIPISYYSQHACGNGAMADTPSNQESVTCQHVLQLGCEDNFKKFAGDWESDYMLTDGISLGRPGADEFNTYDSEDDFYDTFGGTCTQTRPTRDECTTDNFDYSRCDDGTCNNNLQDSRSNFNSDTCECCPRKKQTYCYHEPEGWYEMCVARERNKGLFAADENVNNNGGATKTRQEPNSARYGFECTEERDYWPYWHPSPWVDLAVQLSNPEDCNSHVLSLSQNSRTYCFCTPANEDATWEQKMQAMAFNQKQPCETKTKPGSNDAEDLDFETKWDCDSWAVTEPSIPQPECILAEAQIDNRLGNTNGLGDASADNRGQDLPTYNWEIPYGFLGSEIVDGVEVPREKRRCVIRLRYNISTAETLYTFDDTDNEKVKENPVHTYGDAYDPSSTDDSTEAPDVDPLTAANPNIPVRMAINTAQFGRTFEDRTYVFEVIKRDPEMEGYTIHNLNVRGKRGNIAQVRNCLEYDFHPTYLKANVGDKIVFQWAMSDYNNNGNAGEGRQGTDRTNIVPVPDYRSNLPQPLNNTDNHIFDSEDLRTLAWIKQEAQHCYSTQQMLKDEKNNGNGEKSCHFLNGARREEEPRLPTAYFYHVAEVRQTGTFNFMCSRNNNFTNRSQKGTIDAGASALSTGAIVGIAIGGVVGVAALAGLGFVGFQKFGSTSRV